MTKSRYIVVIVSASLLAVGGNGTAHAGTTSSGTGFTLTFTETTPTNAFFIVANLSDTATEMTAINVPVTVSYSYSTPSGTVSPASVLAFLNFEAISVDAAVIAGPDVIQNFNGSYAISSGSGNTGVNYLSGFFGGGSVGVGTTDDVSGGLYGSDLTLSASQPVFALAMTSNVIPTYDIGAPLDMLILLSNVYPMVGVVGPGGSFTVASATAIDPGYFSANLVQAPEPASLAVLGVAFSGLAVARWGRRKRAHIRAEQRRLGVSRRPDYCP
jgi:hypothetical protein